MKINFHFSFLRSYSIYVLVLEFLGTQIINNQLFLL